MLTDYQIDALSEMINIGVGRAAGVLNTMLRSRVVLRVPQVQLLTTQNITEHRQQMENQTLSAVRIGFTGSFAGKASMIFPTENAIKLVVLITEEEAEASGMDSMMIGTLTEVGNIVLNGVMGAIGNELQERIFYSVPSYIDRPADLLRIDEAEAGSTVVWVQTNFSIEEHQIDGEIVIIFELGGIDLLLMAIERRLGE